MKRNNSETFPAEIRKMWGYSDAKDDIKNNRPLRHLPTTFHQARPLPYWDKAYCEGYNTAWRD